MNFPSDDTDPICNVDGIFNDLRFQDPSKELAEYFIQFRTDDIIETLTSLYFFINIDEHEILRIILEETIHEKEGFRNIVRDAVTLATLMINFDRSRKYIWAKKEREIRNKIKIDISIPQTVDIKELSANEHEGHIVTFPAKISVWSKLRSITVKADYQCPLCGDIITKEFKPKIIDRCLACNALLEFYKPNKSEDTRRIQLREIIDDYSDGKLPATITADIYGRTVQEAQLSDKVMVTGVFRSLPLSKQDGKLTKEFMPTIQVINMQNISIQRTEYPDEEMMEKFINLEKEGKLVDAIIDGFAFNIYKKRMEKKAVICSLIGSEWVGKKTGGNPPMIHILFVGDPDTYKSTIMKYIINVFDNCVLADSTTVSNAGIKAIAVKMDDGTFSIMAGLLPTYNKGVVFFDEFGDFRDKSIYADLKAPMVDGKVSKHVAGEDFNGVAETGVLASMNPTEGVYDTNKTIYENLRTLEKALITRFDVIFMFSKNAKDWDSVAIREHLKKCDLLKGEKPEGLLSDREIKLFINHVKRIHPILTDEAIQTANDFFAEMEKKNRAKNKDNGTETRTENAVIKFAIALAKWHMETKVTSKHVLEALKLYESALDTFGLKLEEGDDINQSTLKTSVDGRLTAIKKAYDHLKNEDGYAFEDEVVDRALGYNCFKSRHECEVLMGRLSVNSQIIHKDKMIKVDLN